MSGTTAAEVLFDRRGPGGRLGVITLNRPRRLNALSHAMVREIAARLEEWNADDAIEQYLLLGAGERGLCAGGDITEIRDDVLATGGAGAGRFFADEYRLDAATAELPKPCVALMDGVTFGGGVGLSAHGRGGRVVTERSSIAMPEAAIGFVPDVGGTYLLSRMPGGLGLHAGLTGARLGAGDAIATGFADVFVPADALPELVRRLEAEAADAVLDDLRRPAPEPALAAERTWIDEAYAGDDPLEILERLDALAAAHPGAAAAAEAIRAASPTSIFATLELLRRNREAPTLRAALELEYRVGMRLAVAEDFAEGVRAMVVDKDRSPRWRPGSLEAVRREDVEALFDPRGGATLDWG